MARTFLPYLRAATRASTCHFRSPPPVSSSLRKKSTLADPKPYYVTTPIFYVNADPHIGHLYSMVVADVLKRWQVLHGREAVLCTGTDEHGMKIQQAAARAGKPPKEFCDTTAETFKELAKRVSMSNDHFVRTSDIDHKDAVQHFWQMLVQRGHIYESKHEGWYCVSDETFYPGTTIEKRLDPRTGKTFMASKETGKEVEWTSERNYHFRLSAFKDRLLKFYAANPKFIEPATRMNDVVQAVSTGLEDLSVSRPVERLSWGVRVPDDETQTIYVWLDALINYISKAGYPFTPGKESAKGWPADVQVVGKDIVRFHCIYWPAFLMALDLELPKQILTHAHWTKQHQKIAKSTGNVVNPFDAMDRFGVDTMRYYLIHDGGITNDSDYGNHLIVERYKKGLQGGLGNLVNRLIKSKLWNVRDVLDRRQRFSYQPDTSTIQQHKVIDSLSNDAGLEMEGLNPGRALQVIMNGVYETNRYLEKKAPWKVLRDDPDDVNIHDAIYHSAEAVRVVGILLQPFMPEKSSELLDLMGVSHTKRTSQDARFGADLNYGVPMREVGTSNWDSLFPPLPVED